MEKKHINASTTVAGVSRMASANDDEFSWAPKYRKQC